MDNTCSSCRSPINGQESSRPVASTLCPACLEVVATSGDKQECRRILQGIEAPILMMQNNPRLVFTANDKALGLFGKDIAGAEGHRGGEVFNCIHSFTELGCGKDANCEDCKIKTAIVSALDGTNAGGISSLLTIRKQADLPYTLTVSCENIGDYALVRIEKFQEETVQ